jgi:hypothetical protein
MNLKQIQTQMQAALKKSGVTAEITFCREDMFSVLVDDAEQFAKAKRIIALMESATFDSEDMDPECGNIAYYTF